MSKQTITQAIQATSATGLPSIPEVAERFKALYKTIHGANSEAFYEAEKFHFAKLVNDSDALSQCEKLSLYGVFMDVAVSGLSFDPTCKHLYLVPYNYNIGTKDAKKWVKRAQLQISGIGELALRVRQGQIKHADNPVIVYEGDEFRYGTRNGNSFLEHIAELPAKSSKIIACYIRITRSDDSVDYKVITGADMDRFRKFSKDPNSKAWVDGEGGMWQAKCIKHAFRNYPKLRVGGHTTIASETEDTEIIETQTIVETSQAGNIDYGIDIPSVEINQPETAELEQNNHLDF